MKSQTINISVTADMADFVTRQVGVGYNNTSEFFRDLLRERMQREVTADLALLDRSMRGAPSGDPDEAEMADIVAVQKRQRKERRARRA